MEIILDNEVSKYEALVLERTNEGYTIFKNLDTDMVCWEISWSHSIYSTDVVEFELID